MRIPIHSLLLVMLSSLGTAVAADVIVTVSGVASDKGEIACALFAGSAGFPMDASKATGIRLKAKPGTAECRFPGVNAGTYAVAVSHDENTNGKTDTNFVGMPKEPWGVSNNARPRMRAPKFEEASFAVKAEGPTRITIPLSR